MTNLGLFVHDGTDENKCNEYKKLLEAHGISLIDVATNLESALNKVHELGHEYVFIYGNIPYGKGQEPMPENVYTLCSSLRKIRPETRTVVIGSPELSRLMKEDKLEHFCNRYIHQHRVANQRDLERFLVNFI